MMKKIFALVLLLVLGKMSYAQYPITQTLGSDSTIVISKGALQSRLINVTYTDTTAANLQRIRQYPGAQIATTTGGLNLWVRNANATAWIPVATGSGNNIYTIDGTLLGNRTLTGAGYSLTFNQLSKLLFNADSTTINTDQATISNNGVSTLSVKGATGRMFLVDTTAPADERIYELKSSNGEFYISILNDAQTSNDSAFLITSASRVGINTLNPDSTLKVGGGVNILGGLRVGNLPTSPGTKQLRINAQGQFSVTDTLIDAGGTVTSIATNNGSGITGGTITTTGTLAIDTTNVIATKASVSGGLAGKLNISDTAAMLAPYLRAIDTASLSNRINLKLNISDTATMLGNYLNNVGYGLSKAGQVASADSATLSAYYLRRKDSLTATNPLGYVTQKILSDTAAAIRSSDLGGTVTSVATNNGTGITGGTITTSGTLAIDTLLVSTRAWRQKGVDSVAALANTKISGSLISGYLTKATGSLTIDTSQLYQSSGLIGIGTTSPTQKLQVSGNAFVNGQLFAGDTALSTYQVEGILSTPYVLGRKAVDNTLSTEARPTGIQGHVVGRGSIANRLQGGTFYATTDSASTANSTGSLRASNSWSAHNGSGTLANAWGSYNIVQNKTTGTITNAYGSVSGVENRGATSTINKLHGTTTEIWNNYGGTIDTAFGQVISIYNNNASSNIGAVYGLSIGKGLVTPTGGTHYWRNSGTIGTSYGIYLDTSIDVGATKYSIFSNSNSNSYFKGKLGVGTTSPDSAFQVATGALFQRGVRMSGLPTGTGTKSLRVDASGTVSIADTLANGVSGSGTTNYVPKFTGTNTVGNSNLYQNFNSIGVNQTDPYGMLSVKGDFTIVNNNWSYGTSGTTMKLKLGSGSGNTYGLIQVATNGDPNLSYGNLILQNEGANVGINTISPDSALTVSNGAYFQRGVRMSGLPTGTGIKAVRINANGTLSVADTLTNGVSGSLISGYLTKATGTSTIDTSQIYQSSGLIGIGTTTPAQKLDINGDVLINGLIAGRGTGNINTNAVLGRLAFNFNTTGFQNVAIGNLALYSNTTGANNVAIGNSALSANTTANHNVAIGHNSMLSNTTGFQNTAVGIQSLGQNTTGENNTGIGNGALGVSTTGYENVALGTNAGRYITAGGNNTTSNQSVYIGADTRASANGNTNEIVIGKSAIGNGSNSVTLGNASITKTVLRENVGVGTVSPDSALTVVNGAYFQRGIRASGLPTAPGTKALRINASGTISIADTLANGISGTGTTNYIPKFTSSSAIGNSQIQDDGTNVGVGGSPSSQKLRIYGGTIISNNNFYYGFNSVGSQATIVGISSGDNITLGQNNVNHSNTIIYGGTGNIQFSTGGSERMRLTSGGSLGIGTSSPGQKLTVNGDVLVGTNLFISNAAGSMVGATSPSFYSPASGVLGISTNGSERMRLDASGNLGLGTSSPAVKLDVIGAIRTNNSGNPNYYLSDATSGSTIQHSGNVIYFNSNDNVVTNGGFAWRTSNALTELMRLTSTGLGIGTSSPATKLDVVGTGTGLATFGGSNSGSVNSLILNNTSNTSGSDAVLTAKVGGASGGNPYSRYEISGVTTWFAGVNNSASDAFVIAGDAGIGAGTLLTITTGGNLGLGVTPSAWSGAKAIESGLVGNYFIGSTAASYTSIGTASYYNGSSWIYARSTEAAKYEILNNTHAWFNAPSGTAGNAISFTQAMTLDASGRLGIGTTSPNTKLEVTGNIRVSTNGTNGGDWGVDDSGIAISSRGATPIAFWTNDFTNQRMRITSGGNVGIGTSSLDGGTQFQLFSSSSPQNLASFYTALNVSGSSGTNSAASPAIYMSGDSNTGFFSPSGDNIGFSTNGSERMRITSGGALLVNTTSTTNTAAGKIVNRVAGTSNPDLLLNGGAWSIASIGGEPAIYLSSNIIAATGIPGASQTAKGGIGFEYYSSTSPTELSIGIFGTPTVASNIRFWNNGAERMRITSGGELLINTTSDAGDYKLQVNGNVYQTGNLHISKTDAAANLQIRMQQANRQYWDFLTDQNESLTLKPQNSTTGEVPAFRVQNSSGTNQFSINTNTSAAEFAGTIKTAAPSGGTAATWKLGSKVSAAVTLVTTDYIEVEIGGVAYKLALVN